MASAGANDRLRAAGRTVEGEVLLIAIDGNRARYCHVHQVVVRKGARRVQAAAAEGLARDRRSCAVQ